MPEPLYLVSWNVAALPTTIATLQTVYPDRPFTDFLDRWGASVFALQEAKVTRAKREAEPFKCGAAWKGNTTGGWESFWSDAAVRGLNGVVTFAKAGLVHSADAKPLRNAEMDNDGRCVVTRFSSFVLFNVYVPNARGGTRAAYRNDYVTALKAAMDRERRETGLPVILCGDLNMSYRPDDCHWTHRRLDVLAAAYNVAPTPFNRPWPHDAAARRGLVNKVLHWAHIAQVDAGDAPSGNAVVDVAFGNAVFANIEKAKESADTEVWSPAPFPPVSAEGAARPPAEPLATSMYLDPVLPKAREPSHPDNRIWYDSVAAFGHTAHSCDANALFQMLLRGGEGSSAMVDSLLLVRPETKSRATCHNQMTNARYQNIGSRIDYFLVDASMSSPITPGVGALTGGTPCGEEPSAGTSAYCDVAGDNDPHTDFDGAAARAGLLGATASGRFQPAPFSGGGLPDMSKPLCEIQFSTPRQTGVVYTAPQLSDHMAVTLLLDGVALTPRTGTGIQGLSESTKECMHRPKQPGIMAMFAKRTHSSSSIAGSSSEQLKAVRSETSTVAATAAIAAGSPVLPVLVSGGGQPREENREQSVVSVSD